jgi:hypothetical protein
MNSLDYQQQTQSYSTWGDKLLQHTDRLHEIQSSRNFRPITLQLAPTEACDSDCPFCSVQARPTKQKILWPDLVKGIGQFAELGCKAVEITGGGNPCIYRDGSHTINDIIKLCHDHNLKIGLITNTEILSRHLSPESMATLAWCRVSLAKLDEGFSPSDFNLHGLPPGKLGLSYIVHSATQPSTFDAIQAVLSAHPDAKFVRIAADCLTDDSLILKSKIGPILSTLDPRFFIKEINDNYHPFPHGCWIGMIRPYWTSTGIYICTSHVLKKRTYLPEYRLCGCNDIAETWASMNARFASGQPPYPIDISQCWHCYYHNNNQLLSTIINELPDKEFA